MKSFASDTITSNQEISYNQSLVSAGGVYELGFFQLRNSRHSYLGIWYKISPSTIVWVANKDTPLKNSSGVLKFYEDGNLVLFNGTNNIIWSTNISWQANNPTTQLLDSGNLVVTDQDGVFLWQSFDYMGDTFLPGMKYGIDLVTGLNRYLTSSKDNDPSPGMYTNILDPRGYAQILLRKGSEVVFRSGPWNGLHFSGMPSLKQNSIYTYKFVYTEQEIYYKYELTNSSFYSRMILDDDGFLQHYTWSNLNQNWNLYFTAQMDNCDKFSLCGPFGSCNINNSPICECLPGFRPKFLEDWISGGWSTGCVRNTEFECGKDDGFLKVKGIKLPDTRKSWYNTTIGLKECESICRSNCSCTAYSNIDIRDGSGCLLWFGDLIDIRQYSDYGQDFYIRLSQTDLGTFSLNAAKLKVENYTHLTIKIKVYYADSEKPKHVLPIVLPMVVVVIVLLGIALAWWLYKEGKSLELIDDTLTSSCIISEVLRTVQENPEDRPNMAIVGLLLGSDQEMPDPNEPGFFTERKFLDTDSSSSKPESYSLNNMTITLLSAR
ncbi:hypothetical protein ACFE04_005937 [Oxalis oulophora]